MSNFKKTIKALHLWLGMISGIVVLIVSITGCIFVFQREIRDLTEPYQFVTPQSKSFLSPNQLKTIAASQLTGKKITAIEYFSPNRAVIATSHIKKEFYQIYLNPYTGEVLRVRDMNHDFLRTIIRGHTTLWLSPQIGREIVAYGVLLFFIVLLCGFILWWPKSTKKTVLKNKLSVKWSATRQRLNFDLHNVFGFYAFFFALIIALTGLVWGFSWIDEGLYRLASGGKAPTEYAPVTSTITPGSKEKPNVVIEKIWQTLSTRYAGTSGALDFHFAASPTDPVKVSFFPDYTQNYNVETHLYDQYSGEEITHRSDEYKNFGQIALADKMERLNHDIHTGVIGKIPGKIIAFFASLICATLPVTGFCIWWNKRRNRRKKK